jgi:hypothetical protein
MITFITWSERKAYRLLSLARNAGYACPIADIPKYLVFKSDPIPYKSFVGIECDWEQFDTLVAEMYETVQEPDGD